MSNIYLVNELPQRGKGEIFRLGLLRSLAAQRAKHHHIKAINDRPNAEGGKP